MRIPDIKLKLRVNKNSINNLICFVQFITYKKTIIH